MPPARFARRLPHVALLALLVPLAACSEITDAEPGSDSYSLFSDAPSGTSTVRASNGTSFGILGATYIASTGVVTTVQSAGGRFMSISLSLVASSGGTSGGSSGGGGTGGGASNFTCPGSLPSGYQCLSNAGQYAPGRYNLPVLQGTWVESSFQACMTLNSNGTSAFRHKSGFPPTTGQWGALVTKTGQFVGQSGTYTVFTGSTDPQIKLLVYDTGSNRWVGWGFQKGSCPW